MEDNGEIYIASPAYRRLSDNNRSGRACPARSPIARDVSLSGGLLQKDILQLTYTDIEETPKLRHLRYGFVDESDFGGI